MNLTGLSQDPVEPTGEQHFAGRVAQIRLLMVGMSALRRLPNPNEHLETRRELRIRAALLEQGLRVSFPGRYREIDQALGSVHPDSDEISGEHLSHWVDHPGAPQLTSAELRGITTDYGQ